MCVCVIQVGGVVSRLGPPFLFLVLGVIQFREGLRYIVLRSRFFAWEEGKGLAHCHRASHSGLHPG